MEDKWDFLRITAGEIQFVEQNYWSYQEPAGPVQPMCKARQGSRQARVGNSG